MTAPAIASPLDTARGFAGELRSRSEEIEQCRTLPRDLVDSLTDAGMFRFWVPADVRRLPGAGGDRPRHVHRARPPRRGDRLVHVHRQHDGAPRGVHGTRAGARRLRAAGRDHRWLRAADGPGPGRRRRAVGDRTLAVGLGNAALHDGRRRCARRRRRRRTGGAPRRAARCVRVLRPLRRRVLRHVARRRPAGNRLVRLRGPRRVRAGGTLGRHGQPCPARRRRAVPLLVLRPARGRSGVHGDRDRRSRGRGVQGARRREDAPELQPCPGRAAERPGRCRPRRSDGAERDRVLARRDGRRVGERDERRRTVGRPATDDPPRQHRRHATLRRHREPALPECRRRSRLRPLRAWRS